jgi:trimeric autotransporter adhesin
MPRAGHRICVASLLLSFALAVDLRGQSFQGGLRGSVSDPQGVIPGVTVTMTNEGTSVARTSVSNEVGEYVFTAVVPGTYTVRAMLTGFKTFERKGIVIGTQQFLTLDLLMEVGSIEEQVTVTAAAPLIETSNASTGQVLSKEALDTLPTGGRVAYFMAETVPSVVPVGNPVMNRFQDQGTQSSVSLGGGPSGANNYLLDGVSITDLTNRPVSSPSIEALGEVKVQVHTYDAEMGRTGGGVYNSTGRSGTNTFHGSGFVQTRPRWGAANDYYNDLAGIPLPPVSYGSQGGSIGGPIARNRTFFWATTENNRLNAQRTGVMTMPTAAMRAGDLSQLRDAQGRPVIIYDPLTTRPNPSGSGFIRDPFPGNIIPANRIDPVARALLQYFPNPDAGAGSVNNFTRTAILHNKANQLTTKVDHKLSDSWSVSGMYLWQTTTEPAGAYYGGLVSEPADGYLERPVDIVTLNNTIIPNSSSVVSLRYGYTRFRDTQVSPSSGAFDPRTLGFASAFTNGIVLDKFPQIIMAGYGEQVPQDQTGGAVLGDTSPSERTYFSHVLSGNWAKFIGTHNLKIGADYRQLGANLLSYGQTSGSFSFNKSFTQGPDANLGGLTAGDAFASFLLGYPSVASATIPTPYNIYTNYYGGYFQDDWRATSRLTVNVGLRYEYEAGLKERDNHMVVGFDRTAVSPLQSQVSGINVKGGLMFAGVDGNQDYQANPSKAKFAPRVGVAWRLPANSVLRGGYGRFFVPGPYSTNPNVGALGYNPVTQYFASSDGGLTPAGQFNNPFPTGLLQPQGNTRGLLTGVGGPVSFIDQNNESGYVHQYSIDYERELPFSTALSIGYVGSRSEQLSTGGSVNINQLDPQYLSLGSALQQQVPNPFFGFADAGSLGTTATIARGQLLRPFPQFLDVLAFNSSQGIVRYNALVLQLERRMSKGFGARVAYTYANRKDNLFGVDNYYARQSGTLQALNNYDIANEYGTSLQDTPNRLNVTAMFDLPFGRGRRFLTDASGLVEALAGGWNITMIGMYQTGFPTPIMQSNNNSGSFGGGQRPNLASGTDLTTPGDTIDRLNGWYNPAAFTQALPFTFGNAPRTLDDARTPTLRNWDLAIEKRVPVKGSVRGVFRLEAFDVFNFKNFRGPDTRFGLSTFGRITQQTGTNRQVQLTFRVQF